MRQVTIVTDHFYSFSSHSLPAQPSRKIRQAVSKQQQRYIITFVTVFQGSGKFKKGAAMLFAPRGRAKMSAVVI